MVKRIRSLVRSCGSWLSVPITLCALAFLLGLGCGKAPEANDVHRSSEVTNNHLSNITMHVVRESVTDPHGLAVSGPAIGARLNLILRQPDGSSTDLGVGTVNGMIRIPAFRTGKPGLSTVDVYVNDVLYGGIDVYATDMLPVTPAEAASAVISRGNSSFLLDFNLLKGTLTPRNFGGIPHQTGTQGGPPSDGISTSQYALSDCGNGYSGPGVGRFYHGTPGSGGQLFSYAPESSTTLQWAATGDQAIDAIYRRQWGCTAALKVPNNCTAFVDIWAGISWCCGFPYVSPSWINPSTDPYFPDCPL